MTFIWGANLKSATNHRPGAGWRQSYRQPISVHHDSRKRSLALSIFFNRLVIPGEEGSPRNRWIYTRFCKDTRSFLILAYVWGIYEHGGGDSRNRRSPQSAPDIRETERLPGGLQPAHLRRLTLRDQPDVFGFRLQLLRRAAHTKEAEAHTLESRGESTAQVGFVQILAIKTQRLALKAGHCGGLSAGTRPKLRVKNTTKSHQTAQHSIILRQNQID